MHQFDCDCEMCQPDLEAMIEALPEDCTDHHKACTCQPCYLKRLE